MFFRELQTWHVNKVPKSHSIQNVAFPYLFIRTYADRLSPKVVQSLLDLLCSQLKTLLAQAAGSTLSASTELQEKTDDCADAQKKDFRGRTLKSSKQPRAH